MTTFKIDDVKQGDERLEVASAIEHVQAGYVKHTWDPETKVRSKYLTRKVWITSDKTLIGSRSNPVVGSAAWAHDNHLPLSISPDSIWLCIAQGFATFVLDNAESLRKQFVDFEGKVKLVVDVPFGNDRVAELDWDKILGTFSDQIGKYTGKKRDLFIANFSTTGIDERMASEVVLMKAMSEYFTYGMRTLCGFPRITLEGTVDDWKSIRDRFRVFAEFRGETDLEWWSAALMPILDQLVATAEGNVDTEFWRSYYKRGGGSGGPYINGWINAFFPYLPKPKEGWVRNGAVLAMAEGRDRWHGPSLDDFPEGMVTVDVEWDDLGNLRDMQFHGGLLGISQAPDDLTIRAECGWAVSEAIER